MAVHGLIWMAFGLRVFFVERLPYDYDRSYAHGVGMAILHQLGHGLMPTALLHSESSNSGLTNPVLTNYVFALIGLLDRSPYSATVFTAALGALIAALTYDLGRRVLGRRVGLIALALVASSPWSAYFARGAWYTGYFELSAALSAWLLFRGLLRRVASASSIGLAVVSSAILAHFYLVSFALAAQMAAVLLLARARVPARAKLFILFCAAWLISLLFMAAVVSFNRASNIRPGSFELVYGNPSPEEKARLSQPRLNLITLTRFDSLMSGRLEGWLDSIYNVSDDPARASRRPPGADIWLAAYQLRMVALEAALLTGFGLWLLRARSNMMVRWLLVWLLVPVLGQIVVTSLLPSFPPITKICFLPHPPAISWSRAESQPGSTCWAAGRARGQARCDRLESALALFSCLACRPPVGLPKAKRCCTRPGTPRPMPCRWPGNCVWGNLFAPTARS